MKSKTVCFFVKASVVESNGFGTGNNRDDITHCEEEEH